MGAVSVKDRLCPLYGFDHDLLVRNVREKKAQEGLTFEELSLRTAVSHTVLAGYFRHVPKRPLPTGRSQITAEIAFRLLMWLGDYDIRDYLLEEK